MAGSMKACPDKTNLKIEESTEDVSPRFCQQDEDAAVNSGVETLTSEQPSLVAQNNEKDDSNMKQPRVSFDKIEIRGA